MKSYIDNNSDINKNVESNSDILLVNILYIKNYNNGIFHLF
jgi:hypothetical protein